uniref:TROVE domain-containing protein n=1 Tax=Ascaris lumbricoides TaxID=6252 RepID=A0A0M3IVE4_ASCLU
MATSNADRFRQYFGIDSIPNDEEAISRCVLPHSLEEFERNSTKEKKSATGWENAGNSEMQREMFRRPRDAMLVLAATFIDKATPRLKELAKLTSSAEHVKIPEVFDHKCHVFLFSERNSTKEKKSATGWENAGNSEMQREMFRRPRDAVLVLAATFIDKATPRLKELAKLTSSAEHVKIPEVFDHKCHVKLSEIALSLLKVAPYDLNTMACLGLQKYFTSILPVTDWSVEGNRSALNIILRRFYKTIQKIGKKLTLRRRTNWTALSNWLSGLYQTPSAYPYIAHLHPLKVRVFFFETQKKGFLDSF